MSEKVRGRCWRFSAPRSDSLHQAAEETEAVPAVASTLPGEASINGGEYGPAARVSAWEKAEREEGIEGEREQQYTQTINHTKSYTFIYHFPMVKPISF